MTVPPDFPWRAGMLAVAPAGYSIRLRGHGEGGLRRGRGRTITADYVDAPSSIHLPPGHDWRAAFDDSATLGAMLGAVREAYGDCNAHLSWDGDLWHVYARIDKDCDAGFDGVATGETEAEALLSAWTARPTVPR